MILQNSKDEEEDYDTEEKRAKQKSNELADPVHEQYIQLLQNIRNLCLDESIYEILLESQKEKKGRPPVTSTFQKEIRSKTQKVSGQSAAKDILIRAILKPRKRKVVDPNNCLEADRIEIEYFKEKVACIKEAVEEELDNPVKKNQPKSYIDLAGQ